MTGETKRTRGPVKGFKDKHEAIKARIATKRGELELLQQEEAGMVAREREKIALLSAALPPETRPPVVRESPDE